MIELRRYTNLPVLLDIIMNKKISIFNYHHWDDANDRYALDLYKRELNYGFVGAFCMTEAPETFHHWKIYSPSTSGICIVFDKDTLLKCVPKSHFVYKNLNYLKLGQPGSIDATDIHILPFIKRYGFKDEREFRILSYSVENNDKMEFSIDTSSIIRIILSPFISKNLFHSIKTSINSIEGFSDIKITHSSLMDDGNWKSSLDNFVDRHGIIYGEWTNSDMNFNS